MTSVEERRAAAGRRGTTTRTRDLSVGERVRRAAPLLVGAVAVLLLIEPIGPLTTMFWVPFISGLSFLGAAAMAGTRGPLWAPGIVLTGWSLQPASVKWELFDVNGSNNLVLGVVLLVAALLGERVLSMSLTSLAIPVLFIGSYMALFGGPTALFDTPVLIGALVATLGLWGLAELRPRTEEVSADAY